LTHTLHVYFYMIILYIVGSKVKCCKYIS